LNTIDLVIIATVVVGFILGYKDGLIRKLIGLIGFAMAIISAAVLKDEFGKMIESALGIEFYLAEIIGSVIIFFAIILVFALLKRIVHPFDKVNNFLNQIVGGLVGTIQLLYFLSAVFMLLNIFSIPGNSVKENSAFSGNSVKENSAFYNFTYSIIPETIDYLNEYTPNTKKLLKEYIMEKDSTE